MNRIKLITNFLRYLTQNGVSDKSLKYYKSDIVNFLNWLGDREVSRNLVNQYITETRNITPPSTINRRLSTLRSYASFISSDFMRGIENVSFVDPNKKVFEVTKNSPYKFIQETLIRITSRNIKLRSLLERIFFNRPKWYKRYHTYPIANYLHFAILILFTATSGYALYDQVFRNTGGLLAFPSALTRPNRYLSFQGRLTDDLGNPETTATNMVFKLYNASSGGTELWNSGTCSITPDQDGIFSTLLGSSCGTEIASSVFSENAGVWLGVTVGSDSEATPRIQIATVAYALNSETLQGFPAGTGTSTIPYIDSTGKLAIAASSPSIESTSGTFAVKGQAMTISTADTTNGDITINPDGTGTLNLTFEGTSPDGGANGFVNTTNANITSGSLYSGTVASNATGYNFINFLSGSSPTSVFSVQNDGDILTSGDITIGGGNINTGNIALTIGDGTTDSLTVSTDGTGDGEVVLPDNSIGPNELMTTGQTDEYCLTYEATGTTLEWQLCGSGGGSSVWSDLTNPTSNLAVNHSTYTTSFNWETGTGTNDLFSLTTDNSANGTGSLLNIQTGTSSTVSPLRVRSGSTESIFVNSSGNIGIGTITQDRKFEVFDTTNPQLRLTQSDNNNYSDFQVDSNGDLTITASGGDVIFANNQVLNIGGSGTDTAFNIIGNSAAGASVNMNSDNDLYIEGDLEIEGTIYDSSGNPFLNLWALSSGQLFPSTLTNLVGIGTNSPISRLSVVNNPGAGNYTGKAALLVDQYESEDILTASASGVTKLTLKNDGTLKLHNSSSTITNDTGDIVLNSASGDFDFSADNIKNLTTLNAVTGIFSGVLQAGNTSATTYSRLGTGTTAHSGNISSASDLLLQDLEVDGTLFLDGGNIANAAGTAAVVLTSNPVTDHNTLSSSSWLVENTANVGQAALMINQTKSGDLLTASASGTTKFTVKNDGSVALTNQIQLGNLSSAPTPLGPGSMFFNTTTNTNQCYDGVSWYNCGGTLYSNTNATVADGNYITVTHNLATNDLLSSAWINSQGAWKSLDATYKPAIAWEGKDTQKGLYHNDANQYIANNESGAASSTLHSGYLFDTFEDGTKIDNANTSASINTEIGDNGSSNYTTLNQRIQSGRVGLLGGQTLSTSETDNDGQTYLGSNTVNDIYYYDRSKDSIPEVLVELGIDPNWYNGVTLSVATSSAQYSQSGTLSEKNPNLTTNYNGSLVKVSGTDSDPKTIYITIKSPTTFDWTNYYGDSATGVTITPGTAQTLGSTGVSVTFTGGVNYNVGDVFKIASWYIEGESATRGSKQQFPERSYVTATNDGSDIIDADTQKLWMRFVKGTNRHINNTTSNTSVKALNGYIYVGSDTLGIRILKFNTDSGEIHTTGGKYAYDQISLRNTANVLNGVNAVDNSQTIVSGVINDVDAAVIPNAPTQEVTVSGWGYIVGNSTSTMNEAVNLPYTFNSVPNVTTAYAAAVNSVPKTLTDCSGYIGSSYTIDTIPAAISKSRFTLGMSISDTITFNNTYYYCYTWTATGTVSPKQFVAVATGATNADGGTTIINETDGTKADIQIGSQYPDTVWQTKVAYGDNQLFVANNNSTTSFTGISAWEGVHGLISEVTIGQYRKTQYGVGQTNTSHPTILGSTSGTLQVKSLNVKAKSSSLDPNGSTLYIGTAAGVTVMNEVRDNGNWGVGNPGDGYLYPFNSVKYYTKDYISEEMVGDIRGMWPFSSNGSLSMSDASIKGNTLTNNNSVTAVSGVRGVGASFNGTNQFLSLADDPDFDFSTSFSSSVWVKTTSSAYQFVYRKTEVSVEDKSLAINENGQVRCLLYGTASTLVSNRSINDGGWHHVVCTYNGSTQSIYIDGVLDASQPATGDISDGTGILYIGQGGSSSLYFNGSIDELMLTAAPLTSAQVKHMYQVGYRALQGHSTGLSSGTADGNQSLAGASNNIGVVTPDDNNQYMYVGTNHTTDGALTKIQLNSDTAIKNWDSGDNDPDGGAQILDDDVTSLAVGETLYAVGSAASGVKTMGLDNNATATSGDFVSKTYTLPKNIGSAVLWVSPVTDSNDGSNTITVQASNDGGSNYTTCTLVGTDSNYSVAEKEYSCTFSSADNDLKIRFQFARGSTKTNTYVVQYGISWLGETGFRVEQADNNNVRLYNFSGETQNLKLNVTGASTSVLANPWTDGGSYIYATGYETLRIYDGGGTNYLGISHDGTLANLTYNGTTVLSINSTGDLLPNTDDTQSLGSDTKRWKDLFLGGETLHLGTSITDEGTISYDTTNNILNFGTDSTTNGDIAFFTDNLYLDKSTGYIGIGTTSPESLLHLKDSASTFLLERYSNVSTGPNLALKQNRAGAASQVNDQTGYITYKFLNSALAEKNSAQIMSYVTNVTSGSETGDLEFRVYNSGAINQAMRILGNGNVGIGTTSPSQKLVVGDTNAQNTLRISGHTTTNMAPAVSLFRGGAAEWVLAGGGALPGDLVFGLNPASYTDANLATSAKMMIQGSTGNVGIGTAAPSAPLEIITNTSTFPVIMRNNNTDTGEYWRVGPADSDSFAIFTPGATGVYLTYGGTSWTANSDERLKTNIQNIVDAEGLEALLQLSPVDYNWKDVNSNQDKQTGFIAQEVQRLFPNLVSFGETTTITKADGTTETIESPLGVNYTGFIPYIIKGIQQQQKQINELVVNKIANAQKLISSRVETSVISPIANTDLIIDLEPGSSSEATKLVIQGNDDQEVASIDSLGNANFSGELTANALDVLDNATISGTLYADDIKSAKIEEIENLLREVEENQTLLSSTNQWATDTTDDISSFESVESESLFITNIASIFTASVSNTLSLGSDFVLQSEDNSINTLTTPLKIQSLALSPLEIMAGKIVVDTNGDTKFLGNVEIAGNLKVDGMTEIENAVINNLVVANSQETSTDEAEVVEGVVNSNAVAGKAILTANSENIRINNTKVKESTLIYVTPITSTQNKVLYVKSKGDGFFEIGFNETLDADVEFNWWIIEVQNVNEVQE